MKTVLLMLATALAAGAAVFFGYHLLPPSLQFPFTTGEPGPKKPNQSNRPREAILALGRLEPESELIEVGGPSGSRLDRYESKVVQGAFVRKGAPLVYLDSHDEMEAALKHSQAVLAEARNRLKSETAFGDAAIAEATLRIQQVEEVALLGIEAQKAEVRRSEFELAKMRLDFTRDEQMFKDKAITRSKLDMTELGVRQMEEQLARNKATLSQLEQDRDVKIKLTRAELQSARAAKNKAEVATMVDSLVEGVKLAEARLERTIIRAPIDGEVIKISTRVGESVGSKPILMLGNTSKMVAIAEVYETDARFINVGQKAIVTSKAFPDGITLTGHVDRINKLVRKNDQFHIDPTAVADARILEVRIDLDDSTLASGYSNLQVDVKILTGEK